MKALLARVKDEKRQTIPDTVVWQPSLAWPRQFYWLYWEHPTKGSTVTASIQRDKGDSAREVLDQRPGTLRLARRAGVAPGA
jgi:hypothetical protein